MGIIILAPPPSPLGASVPSATPHAVSVSLPTWQDNVDYEEGHERVAKAMKSGYPRFYIHFQIDQLAQLTLARFGTPKESCLLIPSVKTANDCRAFLAARVPPISSRLVQYPIRSVDPDTTSDRVIILHACLFPTESFSVARQFWQHTGDGISSRFAERCLTLLGAITPAPEGDAITRTQPKNKHYAPKASTSSTPPSSNGTNTPTALPAIAAKSSGRYGTKRSSAQTTNENVDPLSRSIDNLSSSVSSIAESTAFHPLEDEDVLARYVEERYGRNLDLSLAPIAKLAMRRRIAGVLRESSSPPAENVDGSVVQALRKASICDESSRGVEGLNESDVWLYPCGMSAIYHAHQLAMGVRKYEGGEDAKSVCFGFPYTDTLKILEKWGSGVHFLGQGLVADLPALRKLCETASPPVLALFCEFPSNPLLRTPPLRELRKLADEFGFMIIIDETIAGFVNVEVLPLADIVVSSLTKVFSGDSNVMGGSLVINPNSPHYAALRAVQQAEYEDNYFDEDAIYMERNSRDFIDRIARENYNAARLCTILRTRRAAGPVQLGMAPIPSSEIPIASAESKNFVVKEVYYPKYMTPENYLDCMRPTCAATPSSPGFGGLFSVTFTSLLASQTFFDALACYKGPSLGTNFTLACPYILLAHYNETDWAQGWGVEKGLVRVSTGLEAPDLLEQWFLAAIKAAELACAKAALQ